MPDDPRNTEIAALKARLTRLTLERDVLCGLVSGLLERRAEREREVATKVATGVVRCMMLAASPANDERAN